MQMLRLCTRTRPRRLRRHANAVLLHAKRAASTGNHPVSETAPSGTDAVMKPAEAPRPREHDCRSATWVSGAPRNSPISGLAADPSPLVPRRLTSSPRSNSLARLGTDWAQSKPPLGSALPRIRPLPGTISQTACPRPEHVTEPGGAAQRPSGSVCFAGLSSPAYPNEVAPFLFLRCPVHHKSVPEKWPIYREKSGRPDLNRGPHRPERCALPGCATPRIEPVSHSRAGSPGSRTRQVGSLSGQVQDCSQVCRKIQDFSSSGPYRC